MSDEIQRIHPEEAMQLILEAVTWENSPQTSSQTTTTVMNPAGLGSYRSFTNGWMHQLIITDFSPEGSCAIFLHALRRKHGRTGYDRQEIGRKTPVARLANFILLSHRLA